MDKLLRWCRKVPGPIWALIVSIVFGVVLSLVEWRLGERFSIIQTALATVLLDLTIVLHQVHAYMENRGILLRGIKQKEVLQNLERCYEYADGGDPFIACCLATLVNSFCGDLAGVADRRWANMTTGQLRHLAPLLYEIVKSAGKRGSIDAVSMNSQGTYWSSKEGWHYENLNREAYDSGVTIRRVFVLRDAQHLADMRPVLDRHYDAYKQVKTVCMDDLKENQIVDLRDFTILNTRLVIEFFGSPVRAAIENVTVSFMREDAAAMYQDVFKPLWERHAKPYVPSAHVTPPATSVAAPAAQL
jgi:hypothetical protein